MKPEIKDMGMTFDDAYESKDKTGAKVGIVEGYAAAFDNVDFGDDVIHKGAFAKTIREKKGKWPILADHDPTKQIGVNLEASEDDRGLKIKEEINLEISLGKERYSLVKQSLRHGLDAGLSIGYGAVRFDFSEQDEKVVRNLKELKMFEHSHVTFPMNDQAFTTEAKNWATATTEDKAGKLVAYAKNIGVTKEDIIAALEYEDDSEELELIRVNMQKIQLKMRG